MLDLRQSSAYANYLAKTGWVVEKADSYFVFIRCFPLTPFSFIKCQRPTRLPLKKIETLAKKHHALQVVIEPLYHISIYDIEKLKTFGYRLSKSPFLPTKTIHLDLARSEKKILAQMAKDARYGIKKAKREGIKIKKSRPEDFRKAWKKSVGWRRYVPSLKNLEELKGAFGPNALFLTALHYSDIYHYSKEVAGVVILKADKTAYYYYALTSKKGRKLWAQYLLVWEAIKWAKKQGCQIFDFEGIYDSRFPIKSWQGFSHFKKSFGGKEVNYPGCFVKNFLAETISVLRNFLIAKRSLSPVTK